MDVLGKLSLGTNKKLAGNCLNTYVLCGVKQSVVPTKDLKKKKKTWLAAWLLLLMLSELFEAISILCASRETWREQSSARKRVPRCSSASELHGITDMCHCQEFSSVHFGSKVFH